MASKRPAVPGTTATRTYIEEHDLCVREVGLKGGAVVVEVGSVGGDRAAVVDGAVGRRRRLPPNNRCSRGVANPTMDMLSNWRLEEGSYYWSIY